MYKYGTGCGYNFGGYQAGYGYGNYQTAACATEDSSFNCCFFLVLFILLVLIGCAGCFG